MSTDVAFLEPTTSMEIDWETAIKDANIQGSPYPLGVTWVEHLQAYNFALYAKHAEQVNLLFYTEDDLVNPAHIYHFDYLQNKSHRIWHCLIRKDHLQNIAYYAYQVFGPPASHQYEWHTYNPAKVLLDPYAKSVYFPPDFSRMAALGSESNAGKAPLGVLDACRTPFDWEGDRRPRHTHDLIIYEMHVRGFTRNQNSGVSNGAHGTFRGVIEKIPHLKELGVTAVELMPIFQFDPQEGNYWGYMTLNFFSVHNEYTNGAHVCEQLNEFRNMVKELHKADIEVILDVVYNHTVEGNQYGPTYSFKGIDNSTYYLITPNPDDPYANYAGTGNTIHSQNRTVRRMIIDSMRYWVKEMHIDGFRFDLASIFMRNSDGSVNISDPAIFGDIASDPDFAHVKMIAEPWDASGVYQLGRNFPGLNWMQWNGKYRDTIRSFIKSDHGLVNSAIQRLYGSDDIFPDDRFNAYHPYQSINYLCSHDGFTMYDLVSYNNKHNAANGHNNTDGESNNHSWNCGWEGEHNVPQDVMQLRRRQMKNMCALLMLSNGTPMFLAGDEFMHTQNGNNNPYNQNNETTWLNWDRLGQNQEIFEFFKKMIAFRKRHHSIGRNRFWRNDVRWYGTAGEVDRSNHSRAFAYFLSGAMRDDNDLYVMVNTYWEPLNFTFEQSGPWFRVVNTGLAAPDDFIDEHAERIESSNYLVGPRSVAVFVR